MPALAAMRSLAPGNIALLTLYFTLVCLAVAAACWLLVSRTSSVTEERVFGIGALLLLGGAAAYLSVSALFAGFVAGVLWRAAGLEVRDRIIRDLGYLQHPVIAMLLIVAGATLHVSMALMGLVAVYLVCRTGGKLAGGWIASRLASRDGPRDLGLSLISPGIVGVACALNVAQARGDTDIGSMVFTLVVLGSLASDLASLLIREPEHAR
jgi:hypothetical protein